MARDGGVPGDDGWQRQWAALTVLPWPPTNQRGLRPWDYTRPALGPMPVAAALARFSDNGACPGQEGLMRLEALDHVGLSVSDIDRSVEWYEQVLGLERVYQEAWGDYPAVLIRGGSGVALFPARGTHIEPSAFGSLPHVAFRASFRDYEEARSELRAAGIEFRESDHQVARSMYLLDPDAHLIEITTYEVQPQAQTTDGEPIASSDVTSPAGTTIRS